MKYALVTGCDHGVGLALAAQLAERGYTVAACRINPEERLIEDKGRQGDGSFVLAKTKEPSPCLQVSDHERE